MILYRIHKNLFHRWNTVGNDVGNDDGNDVGSVGNDVGSVGNVRVT